VTAGSGDFTIDAVIHQRSYFDMPAIWQVETTGQIYCPGNSHSDATALFCTAKKRGLPFCTPTAHLSVHLPVGSVIAIPRIVSYSAEEDYETDETDAVLRYRLKYVLLARLTSETKTGPMPGREVAYTPCKGSAAPGHTYENCVLCKWSSRFLDGEEPLASEVVRDTKRMHRDVEIIGYYKPPEGSKLENHFVGHSTVNTRKAIIDEEDIYDEEEEEEEEEEDD
jgi:hypothetical protein